MQPVLFTLGWIDVPSFTALMALALGAGLALTWMQARRMGFLPTDVFDVAMVAIFVGTLVARAGYVTEHWDYFRDHTDEIAQVWQGGLSWYGGLLGGVTGAAGFSAWRRLCTRAVFDALTPGLMVGAALGWIGCHLAGVAYGREVFPGDRWWFLAADLPDIYRLWNPRIATQLLGTIWATVCFVVAMANGERRTTDDEGPQTESTIRRAQRSFASPGVRFVMTMTLYSAGMFLLGFARGDVVPMLGIWRVDQAMDAGIAAAGIAYLLLSKNVKCERCYP
jgi:phosphatidylglycerol:prolipoprotein diacylglycerol transferase